MYPFKWQSPFEWNQCDDNCFFVCVRKSLQMLTQIDKICWLHIAYVGCCGYARLNG